MRKKVIFLDIDGTLTEPGCNEPPASAVEAIQKARANGHYVFLCSGRSYAMLGQLLKYGFDGVIASAGGDIRIGERVIYDCPMEMELAKEALAVLRKNGVYCTIECTGGSYKDMGFDTFLEEHAGEGANSEMLRWHRQMERELSIHPMSEYNGTDPIYKIVILSMRKEQLEEPVRVLGDRVKFCVQGADSYGYINGELHGPEFDKGSGVRAVCEALSLSTKDSIAFGDSMNDVEMIEASGIGICMENGYKELKKLADDVCPSVEDDGIYRAFEKYGLIGKMA